MKFQSIKKYMAFVSGLILVGCLLVFLVGKGIIGNQSHTVNEFDREFAYEAHFRSFLGEQVGPVVLGENTKNTILKHKIIREEAEKLGISIAENALIDRYQGAVRSVGTEKEYLAKVKEVRGFEKERLLYEIESDLLMEKIFQKTGKSVEQLMSERKENHE